MASFFSAAGRFSFTAQPKAPAILKGFEKAGAYGWAVNKVRVVAIKKSATEQKSHQNKIVKLLFVAQSRQSRQSLGTRCRRSARSVHYYRLNRIYQPKDLDSTLGTA
jgi:hypothetical protein